MKIAFATRSGKNITAHFGRMKMYVVVDVEDGREVAREIRELGEAPRNDTTHQRRHAQVLAAIDDCDVVVAGGMGFPIQQHAARAGIDVILTSTRPVEEALAKYLAGTLEHDADLAHDHNHHH
ncbi:MAG: NifB/NifX family molybdenum-iron cluster-binding protein [Actinomycetota bacterium]